MAWWMGWLHLRLCNDVMRVCREGRAAAQRALGVGREQGGGGREKRRSGEGSA